MLDGSGSPSVGFSGPPAFKNEDKSVRGVVLGLLEDVWCVRARGADSLGCRDYVAASPPSALQEGEGHQEPVLLHLRAHRVPERGDGVRLPV